MNEERTGAIIGWVLIGAVLAAVIAVIVGAVLWLGWPALAVTLGIIWLLAVGIPLSMIADGWGETSRKNQERLEYLRGQSRSLQAQRRGHVIFVEGKPVWIPDWDNGGEE